MAGKVRPSPFPECSSLRHFAFRVRIEVEESLKAYLSFQAFFFLFLRFPESTGIVSHVPWGVRGDLSSVSVLSFGEASKVVIV